MPRSICSRISWSRRWRCCAAPRACCWPTRVGLGKTVQAGLILAELRARGLVDRALILCPAGLRRVVGSRVARTVRHRRRRARSRRDRDGRAATGPSRRQPVGRSSGGDRLDRLRQAPRRARGVGGGGVRPGDRRRSASPHAGQRSRPCRQSAWRRTRRGWSWCRPRRTQAIKPPSTTSPASARSAIRSPSFAAAAATSACPTIAAAGCCASRPRRTRLACWARSAGYARAIWQARGRSDRAVQLVAITLARRAASSAAAVGRTLVRRRALLAGAEPPAPRAGLPRLGRGG